MKRLRQKWLDISIKTKTASLMGTGILLMWAIVVMVILQLQTFSRQSEIIMNEYRDITGFLNAFSAENVCLEIYIRPTSESNALEEYLESIKVTNRYLNDLKPSWKTDRRKKFLLKQAIQNAMEFYRRSQTQLLGIGDHNQLIDSYLSLKMQSAYIDGYTRELLHTSMIYGGEQWQEIETANTIVAMAREEHAPLSEDLILRLSNFFRYSLGSDEKLVPLGREIQLLRDYMELQETRFGERITMEIHSDPSVESVMVPKFILQPLVENAILHGLRECSSGGLIRVRTHRGPKGITIHVTDNGCSFDSHQPPPQQPPPLFLTGFAPSSSTSAIWL